MVVVRGDGIDDGGVDAVDACRHGGEHGGQHVPHTLRPSFRNARRVCHHSTLQQEEGHTHRGDLATIVRAICAVWPTVKAW